MESTSEKKKKIHKSPAKTSNSMKPQEEDNYVVVIRDDPPTDIQQTKGNATPKRVADEEVRKRTKHDVNTKNI